MSDTSGNLKASVVQLIDYTFAIILSAFCLKYITCSGRSFAETAVQFSFLSFPIFVGEFLLTGCLFLFILRITFSDKSFYLWHYAALLFSCFVLIKAFLGYQHWGPLALRDAALFYYVSFACMSYVCYRADFFNKWMILILYAALIWLVFDSQFNEYWLMPRIFIGLVLAYKFPDRRIGLLMALGVLLLTPYRYFLDTSRSVILGNFIAVSFVLILWPVIVDRKKRILFAGCSILILAILGAYIFHFSGYRAAQGLLAVDKLNNVLSEMEQDINGKKSKFKKREVETVMIYSPNQIDQPGPDVIVSKQAVSNESLSSTGNEADRSASSIQGMKLGNSVFRILLWQDAITEIIQQKKPFGIDFGKPFRSENLEMIRAAVNEWQRDGWIAMHNSYLNIIYRAGLLGVVFIIALLAIFVHMVVIFLRIKSIVGLFLCASLLTPFVAAFFAVTLELPYTAIPIWSLFGLTLAYAHRQCEKLKDSPKSPTSGNVHAHSHCS
jgi:hypothetical protein